MLNSQVIDAGKRSTPVIWIIIIEMVVIFLFLPREWAKDTIKSEREIIYSHLGPRSADQIELVGLNWYEKTIVKTQIEKTVYKAFLPTKQDIERAGPLKGIGESWIFPTLKSRIDVFFAVLEQMFIRLSVLWSWVPLFLILAIPAIVDGLMTWMKRRYSFAYASPLLRNSSLLAINILFYGPLLVFFLPLPITPFVYPFFMAVGAGLIAMAIGNSQKVV